MFTLQLIIFSIYHYFCGIILLHFGVGDDGCFLLYRAPLGGLVNYNYLLIISPCVIHSHAMLVIPLQPLVTLLGSTYPLHSTSTSTSSVRPLPPSSLFSPIRFHLFFIPVATK